MGGSFLDFLSLLYMQKQIKVMKKGALMVIFLKWGEETN